MIVADLYTDNERIIKTGPTADLYEDKLSDTFGNIGMEAIKLDAYYMGYIGSHDLDIYSRTSSGVLNGTIATFTDTTPKQNCPIGYIYSETIGNGGGRTGTFMEDDEMIINPQGSSNTYSIRNASLRFINQMYPEYCGMDLTNTNANMYFIVAYYSPIGQYLGQGSISSSALSNAGIDLSSVSSILNLFQNAATIDITVPNSTWGDFTFKASELNTPAFSAQTTLGNMARVFFTSYTIPNIYRVKNGDVSSATIRIDPFVRVEYKEGGQKKTFARQVYGIEFAPTSNYMYSIAYGSSTLTPRGQAYSTIYGNREYTGFYRAGLEGQVNIANISSTNPLAYGGNVLAIRGPETYPDLYFLPICTLDDFRKAFCLAFRLDTGILTNSYVDEITWATVVKPDDGFKAEVKTGNITDDGFKTKLRPWQYENFQVDKFEPDDVPDPQPGWIDDEDDPDAPDEDGEKEPKNTGDNTVNNNPDREWQPVGLQFFALNLTELEDFSNQLWSQPKSFYDAIQIAGKQTTSIFDYIQSIRYYPFNFSLTTGEATEKVFMGTGAKLKKGAGETEEDYVKYCPARSEAWMTVGCWNLSEDKYKWRKNFLDYAPYTKMSVYLPYIGSVDLDPAQVASFGPISEAMIWLHVSIDYTTGTLTYVLSNDYNVLCQKTTKIGMDIPLNGNDAVQQSAAMLMSQFRTTKNVLGAIAGGGTSALTGNVVGTMDSVLSLPMTAGEAYVENSLARKQIPVEISSAGGAFSEIRLNQYPVLTVFRTKYDNPENFGHTIGYLCDRTYTIKALNGFTVCRNVDTSQINHAIDAEKAQIKQIMETGFYA